MNWIHPFADGNGRTARAISYVVLSVKLDSLLPGTPTIPEQIASNKDPYYRALEEADRAWAQNKIDVSALESLLGDMLAQQLLNAAKEASGEDLGSSEAPILH
jgi:Fic family protein